VFDVVPHVAAAGLAQSRIVSPIVIALTTVEKMALSSIAARIASTPSRYACARLTVGRG
jgi:hypothetical protein